VGDKLTGGEKYQSESKSRETLSTNYLSSLLFLSAPGRELASFGEHSGCAF